MRGGIVFEGQAIPECRTSCTIFSLSTRSDPFKTSAHVTLPTKEQSASAYSESSINHRNCTEISKAFWKSLHYRKQVFWFPSWTLVFAKGSLQVCNPIKPMYPY